MFCMLKKTKNILPALQQTSRSFNGSKLRRRVLSCSKKKKKKKTALLKEKKKKKKKKSALLREITSKQHSDF